MPSPSFDGRPVLVTGGAGFIGSHLVDALLAEGARVRVLDNLSTGRLQNLEHCRSGIELLEGDIRDLDSCRQACRDIRVVFHQAALGSVPRSMADPATTLAVNAQGTANIFAACRESGVARIVYASSSSVYGDSDRLPKREGEEGRPISPYALSKVMNEELADVFARCYGIEFVGLRYFNVFGPRQDPNGPYAAVVPRFFQAASTGSPLRIYGDGLQSRDWTFIADACRANLLAAAAPSAAAARVYNVAGGNRVSVENLARCVLEITGGTSTIEHDPPRAGDVRHSEADLSAIRVALGYQPQIDFREGLRRTHSFYRAPSLS